MVKKCYQLIYRHSRADLPAGRQAGIQTVSVCLLSSMQHDGPAAPFLTGYRMKDV